MTRRRQSRPVFLIGYMCSGKTTLGRALGRESSRMFIDLDSYIEEKSGMSVGDIFATRGETGFREMERDMLRIVGKMGDVIVACGGGTPCFHGNMDYMNSVGLTVLLECPRPRLMERLRQGRHKRPLIARLSDAELDSFVDEALAQRRPFYSRAAMVFPSGRLENAEEISRSVEDFLRLTGFHT